MSLVVDREPIDLASFPENLRKHLTPEAPPKLQMMAARGMLPIPPEQNVRVLYQLTLQGGEQIRGEATKSFSDMPADIVLPVAQNESHAGVLDWIAARRSGDTKIIEAVVTNAATPHGTVARVARRAGPKMCDIIATNQVRILEAPQILEEMYQNPKARMATVDRLVELCQREQVELKGLPGLQNAIKSGQQIFGKAEDDPEKAAVFHDEAAKGEEETRKLEEMSAAEREEYLEEREEEESHGSGMLSEKIARMSISEKIRLATIGSRQAIGVLIRDPNKMVHMAAVNSPRIRPPDVRKYARNKSLPDSVISFIANKREWTRSYDIKLSLCYNPKTPVRDAMKFLTHIRTNDLKQLMRDRTVSRKVARQAKNLYQKRSGGRR
jgi:hypothetical protein